MLTFYIINNGLVAIILSFLVDPVLIDVELKDVVAEGENNVAFVVAQHLVRCPNDQFFAFETV